jgi:hypothetical protein
VEVAGVMSGRYWSLTGAGDTFEPATSLLEVTKIAPGAPPPPPPPPPPLVVAPV